MRFRRPDSKVEALREISIFHTMDGRQLEQVARHVDEVAFRPGERIATAGEWGRELFVLVDGVARVERDGTLVAHLGEGDVIGEIALIDQGTRTADVVAETACTAFVMHTSAFSTLVRESPAFAERVMQALASRLRAAGETPA
jgi:CRP/FNR family transcriptional regulator, cyclic AMP receptor protein